MIFNLGTFLFEVVNFLVLVYILRRILYRPLQEAIERRREAIAAARTDAEKAREQAGSLQQQLEARLATLDRERQDLIHKAREQADADRKTMLAEAERAVQARREEVEKQLALDRSEALEALHGELVRSAIDLAGRILSEATGATLQRQLAARLVEDLRAAPDDERSRLRESLTDDETAMVETATALDDEVLQDLKNVLTSLAGRAVALSVQTNPALLGGLRLRLGGHVWDASLTNGLSESSPIPAGRSGS